MTTATALRPTTGDDLGRLGEQLAAHGFRANELAVRRLVTNARSRGFTNSLLLDIVADPSAPEAARLRAFGRLDATLLDVEVRPASTPHVA